MGRFLQTQIKMAGTTQGQPCKTKYESGREQETLTCRETNRCLRKHTCNAHNRQRVGSPIYREVPQSNRKKTSQGKDVPEGRGKTCTNMHRKYTSQRGRCCRILGFQFLREMRAKTKSFLAIELTKSSHPSRAGKDEEKCEFSFAVPGYGLATTFLENNKLTPIKQKTNLHNFGVCKRMLIDWNIFREQNSEMNASRGY